MSSQHSFYCSSHDNMSSFSLNSVASLPQGSSSSTVSNYSTPGSLPAVSRATAGDVIQTSNSEYLYGPYKSAQPQPQQREEESVSNCNIKNLNLKSYYYSYNQHDRSEVFLLPVDGSMLRKSKTIYAFD